LKRFKLAPRGQRPLHYEHIPLLALWLNFNEDDGAPEWEEKDEGSRGKVPFE